ncbi:hypothetical protein GZ77_17890 [Endozoicomonas montiporae]|uniref:NRDE family protein n=2 Tax=Endozoicomonas montiporae TaxID=1027273 RepID=A0A081N1T7_9GAMM|nr:NRDE family protein [Endozoicomonas montiporae]AMO58648.1 hypothetical protein EZMO1_4747 [Endozoicomonas montiporae CL-33]KEQ12410.1 hypothetical protein GZ77_17890 [Endozoicomonas montiporae]
MCLIIFSWQPEARHPMTLVANRDEFYDRPTKPAHFWPDNPEIFGGQDEKAGGSWLAINRSGRFAAVTNYRKWPAPEGQVSRGHLVKNSLSSSLPTHEFLQTVQENSNLYTGFNFIAGDMNKLYYYSNIENRIVTLKPGIYGLCNQFLNSPWPKLIKAKEAVTKALDTDNSANPATLLDIMQNTEIAVDHLLPDTGIGKEKEVLLSSIFIRSPEYGTRNTSILTFDNNNGISWHEQTYGSNGRHQSLKQFSIELKA